MAGINLSLFNLIFGLSGKSFISDDIGIFLSQYLPYLLVLGTLWLILRETGWKRRFFLFCEMAFAAILSRGIITETIRYFFYSPRPFEALHFASLIPESGSSFPSGHMTFYFALSAVIFFYNRRLGLWYFIVSLLVGIARIFVGVHWPSDIVGGILIGLLSGWFAHWIFGKYRREIFSPETA